MASALPDVENPPTHSLAAFQILDENLVSKSMIQFHASLVEELLFFMNSACIVSQPYSTFLMTGSFADGLSNTLLLSGVKADIDIMDVRHFMRAIPTLEDYVDDQSLCQFLMEKIPENPAYAKLRLTSLGNNPYNVPFSYNGTLVQTQNGMQYLSSSEIKILTKMAFMGCTTTNTFTMADHISSMTVTGPATSTDYQNLNFGMQNGFSLDKMDQVFSIPCPTWPDVASEWVRRQRIYNWPSGAVIRRISSKGCYLVPKSRSESRTKNLNWAISFSHVEPLLIHSMNDVMIKTYSLLKLIQKSVLQTELDDIISSYIIKTALFWEVEESDIAQWKPEELLHCVRRCLRRARDWFAGNFAPHYFIRDQNLLHLPLAPSTREKAIGCLNSTVCNLDILFQDMMPFRKALQVRSMIEINDKYHDTDTSRTRNRLKENIEKVKYPLFLILNSLIVPFLVGSFIGRHSVFSWTLFESFVETISRIFKNQTPTVPRVLILSSLLQKHILLELVNCGNDSGTNKTKYRGIKLSSKISRLSRVTFPVLSMSNLIVSVIRYIYLCDCQRVEKAILDITQMLCHSRLLRIDYANHKRIIEELCGSPFQQFLSLYNEDSRKQEPVIVNFEFPLTHIELDLLPPVLKLELECRFNVDMGIDPICRPPSENVLLVDSEALFYFMSFCFYHHFDKNIKKISYLHKLRRLCRCKSVMHLHVALNLLGYCELLMGQHREALATYHRSLCVKSRDRNLRTVSKATPYHVAILLYKCFSDEWSEIH
ncbi:hypothetical protein FSP39_023729 [Pinctada imbricata]|uniref:Uncharacterized protein n=1 Tax=Pinctada imbricata TaxID=66713 RepID=A0AA88YT50_PINIB|nr:hypothetical protein FSP39_023729 [Pinctada imbricata]